MTAQRGDFERPPGAAVAQPERLGATEAWGDWFDRAMNSGAPIVDNAGDGTVDGPGLCTCPALPAGHDDADCAAATYRRGAA